MSEASLIRASPSQEVADLGIDRCMRVSIVVVCKFVTFFVVNPSVAHVYQWIAWKVLPNRIFVGWCIFILGVLSVASVCIKEEYVTTIGADVGLEASQSGLFRDCLLKCGILIMLKLHSRCLVS